MSISMYQASIPQFSKMLTNLSHILKKGEEFASAKSLQIACDQVKNGMARIAGVEPPKFEDDEASFADLQERIAKTITFTNNLRPEQINGTEAKEIKFSIKEWKFEFVGEQYLLTWIIPNFYFHVTTAYDILRHQGVEIGKTDYLGG